MAGFCRTHTPALCRQHSLVSGITCGTIVTLRHRRHPPRAPGAEHGLRHKQPPSTPSYLFSSNAALSFLQPHVLHTLHRDQHFPQLHDSGDRNSDGNSGRHCHHSARHEGREPFSFPAKQLYVCVCKGRGPLWRVPLASGVGGRIRGIVLLLVISHVVGLWPCGRAVVAGGSVGRAVGVCWLLGHRVRLPGSVHSRCSAVTRVGCARVSARPACEA